MTSLHLRKILSLKIKNMKKIILNITLFYGLSLSLYSQNNGSDVFTCRGGIIDTTTPRSA